MLVLPVGGRCGSLRSRRFGGAERALETVAEASQSFAVDRVADPGAALALMEQANSVERLQMLGDGGLRQWQRVHDLAAGGFFLRLEQADNRNPRRVRQSRRKARQRDLFFRKKTIL